LDIAEYLMLCAGVGLCKPGDLLFGEDGDFEIVDRDSAFALRIKKTLAGVSF
jgi:hypothetical protein